MLVILLAVIGLLVVSFAVSKGLAKVWETYRLGEDAQKVYKFRKD